MNSKDPKREDCHYCQIKNISSAKCRDHSKIFWFKCFFKLHSDCRIRVFKKDLFYSSFVEETKLLLENMENVAFHYAFFEELRDYREDVKKQIEDFEQIPKNFEMQNTSGKFMFIN